MRLNLAQYRELDAFAEFGSELDATSLAQLERGRRVVEVLKQGQYSPLPVEEQVVSLYAVSNGLFDSIDVDLITKAEAQLLDFMRTRHADLLAGIRDTGKLPEGDAIEEGILAFKESFAGASAE